MDGRMDGGRKTAASALRLFFFSLQKFFAAGWERRPSVCLSLLFHVHPTSPIIYPSASPPSGLCNNGVKHLRLPGNYGRAKTAGQRGAAELRHPAISPCISISPSLPQMTSVLSVWRAPGDRRECRGMKRQMSDLTGTPAAADEDTWNCSHCGLLWVFSGIYLIKWIFILLFFNSPTTSF